MKDNTNSESKNIKLLSKSELIFIIVYSLVPLIFGTVFLIIRNTFLYLEVFSVIFGLISLMIIPIRFRHRDSVNYKKNKSVYEDKTTDDYKEYKHGNLVFLAEAIFLILLSLVFFYLGKYVKL